VEREETMTYFLEEKGFPGVIGNVFIFQCFVFCLTCFTYYILFFLGAIDGSHVRIDKPVEDADSYINRKQYFSIHVQGTANHKLKFMDVFIGYPGSVHDARVLKNSTIYNDLHELCGG